MDLLRGWIPKGAASDRIRQPQHDAVTHKADVTAHTVPNVLGCWQRDDDIHQR